MAINFSNIPTTNPFITPPPGIYKFTVTKAEMKAAKDTSKPQYLRMTLALTAPDGRKVGNLFDNMYDSASPALIYKVGRFTRAIGLTLQGNVELKDLAKLVPNRSGVVEVENIPDNRYPDDPDRKQAQVKLFGTECFWTLDELPQVIEGAPAQEAAPADAPVPFDFDAADGEVPQSNEY